MRGSKGVTTATDATEHGQPSDVACRTGEFRIRSALPDDAAAIAVLCGQLGYPASAEQVEERLAAILPDDAHGVFVAEVPDGCIFGWVEIYARRLLVEDLHAELGGLVVEESNRGQGLGRCLMECAEGWARAYGCQSLFVRSNVIRGGAHRFYRQAGYDEIKRQATFWKGLLVSRASQTPEV